VAQRRAMQEPIRFKDIGVSIGSSSGAALVRAGPPEFYPDPFWVADLLADAHRAGCKVYCKRTRTRAATGRSCSASTRGRSARTGVEPGERQSP